MRRKPPLSAKHTISGAFDLPIELRALAGGTSPVNGGLENSVMVSVKALYIVVYSFIMWLWAFRKK